jgi:hypothetical protein
LIELVILVADDFAVVLVYLLVIKAGVVGRCVGVGGVVAVGEELAAVGICGSVV